MSSTTEQIKEKLDIVDVVSSYIKLDRAGKNLRAKCPFHNEKTPSFYVSPDRGTYYCFGCGKKGDIFSFVEEFEGLDFMGALKILADRAGVEITFDRKKDDGTKRIFASLEEATLFFEEGLDKQAKAKQYLTKRGIEEASIRTFRLGYVRDDWHSLEEHLTKKGFTQEELIRAGLVKKNEKGNVYDTFRGRIMFPIMDSSGRVVAFSGRAFETNPSADSTGSRRASSGKVSPAKYLNSPETVVFKKSKVLYGFDRAKSTIRKHNFSILVEGNTDVVLAHQIGYTNTVAPLGTALTQSHLKLLKRLSDNLVLALDADRAGIASAGKSAGLALEEGFDVKVAELPRDRDPADIITEDASIWKKAVKESEHIVLFLLSILGQENSDDRSFELAVKKEVLPFVALIENKIDQAHFVKRIAEKLSISEDAVYTELSKVPQHATPKRVEEAVEEDRESGENVRVDTIVRQILAFIAWQEERKSKKADELKKRLKEILEKDSFEEIKMAETRETLLFEAEHTFEGIEDSEKMVDELFRSLEEENTRQKMAKLLVELKEAEESGDAKQAKTILKKFHKASQNLEKIKSNGN